MVTIQKLLLLGRTEQLGGQISHIRHS